MEQMSLVLLITFTVLFVQGNVGINADSGNCPNDLEADLAEAIKTCADEMRSKDSKALLESLTNNKQTLKRSIASLAKLDDHERFSRGINLSLLKRETVDDSRLRRNLLGLNVSLLKDAASEEHLLETESTETHRRRREEKKNNDAMKKEIGELVVCGVEKLIKEQPVLQKSIEECAKSNNKNDDESQKKFESCVEDRIKQMCPNLKLN